MKTKSTRKRLLVSSVAMLLVAMLALGTATYAWFTSDPTANADGLKVKATAATGLLINTATENKWTHNATLNKSGSDYAADPLSIDPTALIDQDTKTLVGYKTVAAADNNYAADTTKDVTNSTAWYSEKINAKITGTDATSANVKITSIYLGNGSWSDNLRLALTYTNVTAREGADPTYSTELVGIFSANGDTNGYLTKTGDYSSSLAKGDGDTKKTYTFASSTTKTVTVDNSGEDYFTVYVYLDGEDDQVFTDNIVTLGNAAGTKGVKIDFAIAA